MKNKLFFILRIFISLSLIGLLMWLMRDKMPAIISTFKNADRRYVLLGVFIYFIASIIIALRLSKIVSVQGIKLAPKEAIYITLVGYFFNNFLPTVVGGDLVKAYYIGKKANKKPHAFAAVFIDRFFATIPFVLIPAVTLTFYHPQIAYKKLAVMLYILLAGCALFLWLIFHARSAAYIAGILKRFNAIPLRASIKQGYGYLNIYSKHIPIVIWNFILSLAAQVVAVIAVYIFSKAVGADDAGIGIFFIVVPIVGIITMLPSVNGLGIREGGFIYLLNGYIPSEKAFAISILVLLTIVTLSVAGGVIYTLKKDTFVFSPEEIK